MADVQAKLTVTFPHPVTAFVLVMGGWFPLPFAPRGILLLDRNILGILPHLDGDSSRHDLEANKWWLNFLNQDGISLNPVLCAMESDNRAVPDFDQFRSQFGESADRLRRYLPKAQVLEYSDEHFAAAFQTITLLSSRYEAESKFLIAAAPMLAERKSVHELGQSKLSLFELCAELGLKRNSVAVVAALSCIYERTDGQQPRIGRSLLKPTQSYRQEHAHNAISDLRAIEFLAALNGLGLGGASLCTRDKHLAAMWCGLRISNPRWEHEAFACNVSPDKTVFPRLSDSDRVLLVKQLNE